MIDDKKGKKSAKKILKTHNVNAFNFKSHLNGKFVEVIN